jgi:4-oxalmesaconate hydratase
VIIDAHGHTSAPPEVYEYQAKLIARRAPMKPPRLPDELLAGKLKEHVALLDAAGTDVQLISPRPYTMMHSLFSAGVVGSWTGFVNDVIARQCELYPDRFRGVAGLPQFRDHDLAPAIEELERCVTELGFAGCLLNPDPLEGDGQPPGLGDPYWYPLYERLCQLDVPAMIHSASCSSRRETYSLHFINEESIAVLGLLESSVFSDFPDLKIVVAHGGGAIPYQLGRFRAKGLRAGGTGDLEQRLGLLHYDTCVYSEAGLDLLFRVVGPSRCLFGTERPGTGAPVDPHTGRSLDDLRPVIESLERLSDADRELVFETNARRLYRRAFPEGAEGGERG